MTAPLKLTVQIPEDRLAELEMVFEMFDVKGDRLPASEELENMVRMLWYDPDWQEMRYLQKQLKGLDQIEFNQFVKIIMDEDSRTGGKRGYEEQDVLKMFHSWDPENTGFISRETFLTNMTTRGDPLEEDELEEMMSELLGSDENDDNDENNEDSIEYEPFVRSMFGKLGLAKEKYRQDVEDYFQAKQKEEREKEKEKEEREKAKTKQEEV